MPLLFDYTDMAAGGAFSGTPVISCGTIGSTDDTAEIGPTALPRSQACKVVQWMTGCLAGVTSTCAAKATMTGGQVLLQAISLRCRAPMGAADVG